MNFHRWKALMGVKSSLCKSILIPGSVSLSARAPKRMTQFPHIRHGRVYPLFPYIKLSQNASLIYSHDTFHFNIRFGSLFKPNWYGATYIADAIERYRYNPMSARTTVIVCGILVSLVSVNTLQHHQNVLVNIIIYYRWN